ncbi:MAG: RagB/SusD family nutrient uptake outer membrane protein [Candidatus Pseudobacter hemicellulosilyticus]|uniref:RagB/SusD family nutrient uptake outer membrane protein n=1 Tax=Candidatus Pseudobacter hemicellulosilyticus TaxID=3121375 RepID=A0AAJ5WWD4_9BACT|nr:MAG: RagB/SusD family nutrient uptake outer membrane protein [Pseudobacter sp.]
MNRSKYLIFCAVALLLLGACRKYVENAPIQGQRVLAYTEDYRMLLNDRNNQEVAYGIAPMLSSDDADFTDAVIENRVGNNVIQRSMYTWAKPFYTDQQTDYDYNMLYSTLFVYNVVIEGVMDSKGGTEVQRSAILGEALIRRAFNYFMLTNLHGKQYDAATAATDPAVPLLLEPELMGDLTRTPVKTVYEQILQDTRRAIPLLPLTQEINDRPTKAAGYALLSKVYLFMRDFDNAAAFADSSLALKNTLYDYNTAVAGTTLVFPAQYNDPQILLRKAQRQVFSPLQLSQSLLNLLEPTDLRFVLFVKPGSSLSPAFSGYGFWSRSNYGGYPDNTAVGLSVNETLLIKAECLARAGQKDAAVELLNQLRQKRFRPADYAVLAAATPEEALQLVINERRREFFGGGLRWFDQRRLDKDPQFQQTVTRSFGGVQYTLAPGSNGFVFPLAQLLIQQNPEMTQNPN